MKYTRDNKTKKSKHDDCITMVLSKLKLPALRERRDDVSTALTLELVSKEDLLIRDRGGQKDININ